MRVGVKLAMGWGPRRYIWQTLGSGGMIMLDLRLGILARVDVKKRRIFHCILETYALYIVIHASEKTHRTDDGLIAFRKK